ncbi:GntR family transcriptional regulator [Burkholderia ubonensis]|uniref:GntR family transcriptional regulator n=2 Tax=Burkholderia ubonensis TaxID=101571 RepID=A0A106CB39_9BURK|nr:GntR family transcriptional regulator [Burkholderia ubonensis]KVC92688.1 GntR family transcriptional regulator [Burkholderia ubonensis]KVC93700.1 GntR family transcriptional regulator [Burkholderia ubonensis]KVD10640.1 GntR family transcriptional regulator [Burkholderia ubonensis]KVD42733.1 GntR family transcriptional regulator [Burkholderia ubonensis]KVG20617.1 GntR family transcriptional regulator [Burkholderia ubonensis]
MTRVSLTSPIPLYLQIADALRDRIARGVWQQGQLIPTLEQIAGEFDVARVTARQAVQLLTTEGALTPQRGRGTFVSGAAPSLKPVKVVTSLTELAQMYRATTPELLTIDENSRVPAVGAAQGTLAPGYTYMKRVHSTDGAPYCVISLYLDERIFSKAPERFRTQTVIPLLMDLKPCPIAKAHQTLTIGSADAETARLLRVSAESPVARIERVLNDANGVVIYYADVVYRGDAVKVEMDLGGTLSAQKY